jgi:hypothetical protein
MPCTIHLAKRAANARKFSQDNALASAGGGRVTAREMPFGPCTTPISALFLQEEASEIVLKRDEEEGGGTCRRKGAGFRQ